MASFAKASDHLNGLFDSQFFRELSEAQDSALREAAHLMRQVESPNVTLSCVTDALHSCSRLETAGANGTRLHHTPRDAQLLLVAQCCVAAARAVLAEILDGVPSLADTQNYWEQKDPAWWLVQSLPARAGSFARSIVFSPAAPSLATLRELVGGVVHEVTGEVRSLNKLMWMLTRTQRGEIEEHVRVLRQQFKAFVQLVGALSHLGNSVTVTATTTESAPATAVPDGGGDGGGGTSVGASEHLRAALLTFIEAYVGRMEELWCALPPADGASSSAVTQGSPPPVLDLSRRLQRCVLAWPSFYQAQCMVARGHGVPSPLTRLWLPVTVGTVAVWRAVSAVARNQESLVEFWLDAAATTVRFFNQYIVAPLQRMYDTIRYDRAQFRLMGREVLRSDIESLQRMVVDLQRDDNPALFAADDSGDALVEELRMQVQEGDISMVMRKYEQYIKRPWRALVFGNMLRSILIQIQKGKVDLETATSALDKLMRSNELNFQIFAVVPTILITWYVMSKVRALLRGRRGASAAAVRVAIRRQLREVERVLNAHYDNASFDVEQEGLLVVHVSLLRKWAGRLERRGDRLRLVEDIDEIESFANVQVAQRMNVVHRIRHDSQFWDAPS